MSIAAALRFRWPWREYQERVLKALEGHIADKRLHVVAAPGSGKTVLGLEVFRRLGQPTLVLSPTRTIRDQWIERLRDFLPEGGDPFAQAWQSRDLDALSFFNSLTYQALHTRVRQEGIDLEGSDLECVEAAELEAETASDEPSEEEIGDVAARLKAAGIRVLILDEAHHLRAEWWSALSAIVQQLDEITVVSLTATPPYDVVDQEWNRYVELCGPIDEEISVPELVKAGTLCPHQDYVWLVRCEGSDAARLSEHRGRVVTLINELVVDQGFLADCHAHAWVAAPESHLVELVDSPREAMALCTFLHRAGAPVIELMRTVDLGPRDLPPMSERVWERLLRLYLFGNGWPETSECSERRQRLGRRLRADELLLRRELSLAQAGGRWPRLSLGAAKADACVALHHLEYQERGDGLRQLILTDYIRDEEYAKPLQGKLSLGAWPVFFRLIDGDSPCPKRALAMHTGRLSIIHRDLLDTLRALPECPLLQVREVPAHWDFVEVRSRGDQRLTRALTRLLVDGHVQVLVGTRALLGEGWDAPPVNSLVLASVIGSFMTTNQMRGRAIRTDPAQPGKIASIWHIGAFAELDGGYWDVRDLQEMRARFETFVGLTHGEPVIEGGLERLRPSFLDKGAFRVPFDEKALNGKMAARLAAQAELSRCWQEAIDHSDIGQVLPTVDVPKPPRTNPLDFRGTLAVLLWQLLAIGVGIFLIAMQAIYLRSSPSTLVALLLVAAGVAVIVTGPRMLRVLRLYLNYLPVDGMVRAISLAVRDALCESELLPASLLRCRVIVAQRTDGGLHIALGGGDFAERALFADCVSQVLGPIEAPRYLITRNLVRRVGREQDYHAVPAMLGARAERARAFHKAWRKHVSEGELLYTRTDEGRRTLVRARLRAFATGAEAVAKRMDRWL